MLRVQATRGYLWREIKLKKINITDERIGLLSLIYANNLQTNFFSKAVFCRSNKLEPPHFKACLLIFFTETEKAEYSNIRSTADNIQHEIQLFTKKGCYIIFVM